jgi:hypothetical protein
MERWTGSFARAHTLSICVRLADSGSLQEGVDAPGIRRLLIVGAMSVIRWASRHIGTILNDVAREKRIEIKNVA